MKFESFDDVINYVIAATSNDEERTRINDEKVLFINRGWEEYVLFAVNLLSELNVEKRFYLNISFSVMNSYVICKAIDMKDKCEKLLSSPKSRDILFNDALRLNLDIVGLVSAFRDRIVEVGNIIENELNNANLFYKERIIPQIRPNDGSQFIIISKKEISLEEENIVINETNESTEEENNVLRSLLIVKFGYKNRL